MTKKELEKEFEDLLTAVKSYSDSVDEKNLRNAWEFAKIAHTGQERLTGDPYSSHALGTAKILADWKLDAPSIIAGLLHDTIEDGGATREDLVKEFGEEIARLVDGVSKVSHLKLRGSRDEEFVENLRKMFLAMARDLRVVLVKLADRLHNMQTLDPLPPDKRKRISRETLEVYAPLAERLGMGEIKGQLEDLAFPYVYPKEYERVRKESKPYFKKTEKHIKKMKRALLKSLAKEDIKAEIHARKKHLYSLWVKLIRPEIEWDINKVHDIVALRIILNEVPQCYVSLGIVHSLYKPVPHAGVRDYISQPKPNSYCSIHTTVFGPKGRPSEVQIRTKQMHERAEFGVAAHWAYGEAKARGVKDVVLEKVGTKIAPSKLSWVKQLVDWQKELSDSEEFLRAVKFDALGHRNFVFSPKGDVFDLPRDATPVDYAFAVHTDLGAYIKGAKVDGKIVPLNYKLKSGEVVEIIKTKHKRRPNSGWLDFVVTTTARSKIKKALKS
ncbi:MAG: bifunctional (p)ppGpp synthetase/guanosine-3',5'-bis(diphosphate) 3'-pyrophosphohydrolase [Patescibacteria group bacterium]